MKKDTLGTLLLAGVVMMAAGSAAACYWYLKASAQARELALRVNRANNNRNVAQTLAMELNFYARGNPEILPVLEKSGLKLGTNIVMGTK